jgi:DNA-binding NarL/FixJ family response regulator
MQAVLEEAGLVPEVIDPGAPDDLRAWMDRTERTVVLVTLDSAADWRLLADIHHRRPEAVLVAVLIEATVTEFVRAVSSGAVSAVSRAAEPDEIRQVVLAAVDGRSVLPLDVVRSLAVGQQPHTQKSSSLNSDELAWLRQLAQGATVVSLARQVGYSERMMFRLLRDLYVKLGTSNRTEALLYAQEHGWV